MHISQVTHTEVVLILAIQTAFKVEYLWKVKTFNDFTLL